MFMGGIVITRCVGAGDGGGEWRGKTDHLETISYVRTRLMNKECSHFQNGGPNMNIENVFVYSLNN